MEDFGGDGMVNNGKRWGKEFLFFLSLWRLKRLMVWRRSAFERLLTEAADHSNMFKGFDKLAEDCFRVVEAFYLHPAYGLIVHLLRLTARHL